VRFRSCASRLDWRSAQTVDPRKNTGEDRPGQRDLGHLEDGIAGVPHKPGAGLDQALAERGQRPRADLAGRCEGAQEVGEVVGQGVNLEPDGIGCKPTALRAA